MVATLLLGPISGIVYTAYSVAYWMRRTYWKSKIIRFAFIYPYIGIFLVMNAAHNLVVCTILFREWPKELTTTSRLKRWKDSKDPSRRELADLFGGFLNRQDPGHY